MKKKVILLTLCIGLLAGNVAQAQDVRVLPDSKTVVLSDVISPDTLGICFIVKKGESVEDDSNVYALKNAVSNEKGEIEISFVMPEIKNGELSDGEYDLYIKESGKAVKKAEKSFVYASLETRTKFLGSLTKGNLKDSLENPDNQIVLSAMGCKTEYYNDKTAEFMCEAIKNFGELGEAEFKKQYNMAVAKDNFKDADEKMADELLSVICPEFEDVAYTDIADDELKAWLCEYFAGNTYSDKDYATANILYKFNSSVADKLDDLFDKYNKDLEITKDKRYASYDKLSKKAKTNINIAEALSKKPAKSVEELLEVVEKSIDSGSNSGSGGGGGGSSASSKLPIASSIPSNTQAVVEKEPAFGDMDKAEWARAAVIGLARAGIVSGDENGNFRPNDFISREEYVTMLVLAANKYNKDALCDFKDVAKDAWYYSYVASANEFGVTHGVSEDKFGVGMALTRQDMAVLSLRAKGEVEKIRDDISFADGDMIADYAKDAVSKLYMAGAVSGTGDNAFVPLGQATRAECAQIIFNLFLK